MPHRNNGRGRCPLFLELLRSETAGDPARMKAALAGLRRYQEAERPPPPPPMPALAQAHGATLRDYGGDGPPVLFVPSLINPPNVLDMGDRSLLRWLAAGGAACCCSTGAGRARTGGRCRSPAMSSRSCCR